MCSMTTLFSLTRPLTIKYLMSMCLFCLPLLWFLANKTVDELSQYNLSGLEMESTILSPQMKLFNHTRYDVTSKQAMNSNSIVEVAVNSILHSSMT